MPNRRLVFREWIVALGVDPDRLRITGPVESVSNDDTSVDRTVRQALRHLAENEQELVERVFFMGESIETIAEATGRETHRLQSLLNRSLEKLRACLAEFVADRYGIEPPNADCPVCNSPYRRDIDRIIAGRDKRRTWRPILRLLREAYGLDLRAPQSLIGHEKYHMKPEIDTIPEDGDQSHE